MSIWTFVPVACKTAFLSMVGVIGVGNVDMFKNFYLALIIVASLACLGCSEVPSAIQARNIVLEKQEVNNSKIQKRHHHYCNNEHASYRKNQIKKAIKRGERKAYINSRGCVTGFLNDCISETIGCSVETNAFLKQLVDEKGYTVRPSPDYLPYSYEVSW